MLASRPPSNGRVSPLENSGETGTSGEEHPLGEFEAARPWGKVGGVVGSEVWGCRMRLPSS